MVSVEPIRDVAKVMEIQRRLAKGTESQRGKRRYMLFLCGVYLGLRISDLLRLTIGQLRADKLAMREKKTRKHTELPIADIIRRAVRDLYPDAADDDLVFMSRKRGKDGERKAISRRQAYNDIKDIARAAGLSYPIGCHTLRKTFGYHQYKMDGDIAFLQDWFNHSSPTITLRYIGIDQDRRRKKVNKMERYFRENE